MVGYPGLKMGSYSPPHQFKIVQISDDMQGESQLPNHNQQDQPTDPAVPIPIKIYVPDDSRIGTIIDLYV